MPTKKPKQVFTKAQEEELQKNKSEILDGFEVTIESLRSDLLNKISKEEKTRQDSVIGIRDLVYKKERTLTDRLNKQQEMFKALPRELLYALCSIKTLDIKKKEQKELLQKINDKSDQCESYQVQDLTEKLVKLNEEIKILNYKLEFWKPFFEALEYFFESKIVKTNKNSEKSE